MRSVKGRTRPHHKYCSPVVSHQTSYKYQSTSFTRSTSQQDSAPQDLRLQPTNRGNQRLNSDAVFSVQFEDQAWGDGEHHRLLWGVAPDRRLEEAGVYLALHESDRQHDRSTTTPTLAACCRECGDCCRKRMPPADRPLATVCPAGAHGQVSGFCGSCYDGMELGVHSRRRGSVRGLAGQTFDEAGSTDQALPHPRVALLRTWTRPPTALADHLDGVVAGRPLELLLSLRVGDRLRCAASAIHTLGSASALSWGFACGVGKPSCSWMPPSSHASPWSCSAPRRRELSCAREMLTTLKGSAPGRRCSAPCTPCAQRTRSVAPGAGRRGGGAEPSRRSAGGAGIRGVRGLP